MKTPMACPAANILGVPVSCVTLDEVLAAACRAVDEREKTLLTTANAHSLVLAQSRPALLSHYREADFVLADGVAPVWTSRLIRGEVLPERVAGPLFFERFVEEASRRGYSFFFVGSTNEILERIRARLSRTGVRVAGAISPSFGRIPDGENDRIVEEVNAARPDALFVGMTQPRQELWLSRNRARLDVPLMMGIGAAFEFFAGTRSRPPEWLGRLGVEWLVRLVQEPRRLYRRNLLSGVYVGMVLRNHWRDIAGLSR